MSRPRLNIDEARSLDFNDLAERAYALLQPYESPATEVESQRETRIGRTLDEVPDIYAWLLQLHAYFDHWTEFNMNQFGRTDLRYKEMRVKRDLMENVAKAAKIRYEGTSRRLTQLHKLEDETKMPRGRS